jgi:hypothetical protein
VATAAVLVVVSTEEGSAVAVFVQAVLEAPVSMPEPREVEVSYPAASTEMDFVIGVVAISGQCQMDICSLAAELADGEDATGTIGAITDPLMASS